jgi:heme-degrading monooxygenase HmoA
MLDRIPGFLSIERSVSLSQEQTILSLSYWADEAALVHWRSTGSTMLLNSKDETTSLPTIACVSVLSYGQT